MPRQLPDFLGVGASRSGTTSLHGLLDRHPQVFMAKPKELQYFSFFHPEVTHTEHPMTPEQYSEFFADGRSARARGEISPSYLWVPGAAERIHRMLGQIRILILLRNPIERTFSDFQYSQRKGRNLLPFPEFLQQAQPLLEKKHLIVATSHPTAILWKGFYASQVNRYLELFGRERVFIRLYEEMTGDVPGFRSALTSFLGIDDDTSLDLQRVNESGGQSRMHDEDRERLRTIFRDDILRLETLLDRDLGAWLG
jgi:hypothetical protein